MVSAGAHDHGGSHDKENHAQGSARGGCAGNGRRPRRHRRRGRGSEWIEHDDGHDSEPAVERDDGHDSERAVEHDDHSVHHDAGPARGIDVRPPLPAHGQRVELGLELGLGVDEPWRLLRRTAGAKAHLPVDRGRSRRRAVARMGRPAAGARGGPSSGGVSAQPGPPPVCRPPTGGGSETPPSRLRRRAAAAHGAAVQQAAPMTERHSGRGRCARDAPGGVAGSGIRWEQGRRYG